MVHRMRLCLRPNSQCRWLVVGKCCVWFMLVICTNKSSLTPCSIGTVRSVSLVVHEIVHSSKNSTLKISDVIRVSITRNKSTYATNRRALILN